MKQPVTLMHGCEPNVKMAFINNYTDTSMHMQIIVHFLKDPS